MERCELKGCFVDYDGDRTILVTPEKSKQFEIEFENISLASVVFKKVAGKWMLRNDKPLVIKYPLAYLRRCLKTIQDEELEEASRYMDRKVASTFEYVD